MENNNMSGFVAVQDDGEGVLGKILYYSLSSVLIEKETLARICDELGFRITPGGGRPWPTPSGARRETYTTPKP
jgi:hypothetical protein